MAAEGGEVGESVSNETNSFYVVNGVGQEPEISRQNVNSHLPSMESMLEVATDLQSDHFDQNPRQISGRLEIRPDDGGHNQQAAESSGREDVDY